MGDTDFLRKTFFTIGGLLIWAAHFTLIYGFNAVICARQFLLRDPLSAQTFGIGFVPLVVIVLTLIAFAATAVLLVVALRRYRAAEASHATRPVDAFMDYMAAIIAGLSLVAILWNGVPALMVWPCA